jgi:hypothetical protein
MLRDLYYYFNTFLFCYSYIIFILLWLYFIYTHIYFFFLPSSDRRLWLSKNTINICLPIDLLARAFFGGGESVFFHWLLCCFVNNIVKFRQSFKFYQGISVLAVCTVSGTAGCEQLLLPSRPPLINAVPISHSIVAYLGLQSISSEQIHNLNTANRSFLELFSFYPRWLPISLSKRAYRNKFRLVYHISYHPKVLLYRLGSVCATLVWCGVLPRF